jgi:hypothetical protein
VDQDHVLCVLRKQYRLNVKGIQFAFSIWISGTGNSCAEASIIELRPYPSSGDESCKCRNKFPPW